MQTAHEYFTTNSEIIELSIINNGQIALYTKNHGIKFASIKKCKVEMELRNKKFNPDIICIAFAPNAKHLAFYVKQNIYVLHIHTNLIIQSIPVNDEKIELLSFDISSRYIIAGTSSGRVLQYNIDGTTLLTRLCSFPAQRPIGRYKIPKNFVSAIAFHKNKVACSGYDGAIIIVDLITLSDKIVISHARTTIDTLCFIDEDTIVSGNRDGVIYITSISNTKKYKQLNAPFINIKQIIVMPDSSYIMLHSQTNYIAVINIKTLKIIDDKYLIFQNNIKKMLLMDNTLMVALQNDKVLKIKLPSNKDLKYLTKNNFFEEAYKLILDEPILKNTQEHKELESKYDKIYLQAIDALIKNNKEYAMQLMEMFKNIPSKQGDIRLLLKTFNNYPKYKELYINKRYALFYAMSDKFSPLQKTIEYKNMEKIWKEKFTKAHKEVVLGNKVGAKAILSEYMTIISKREIIHLVIHNNSAFIDFLKAIDKKDYQKTHRLAQTNNLFTKIPSFNELNIELDNKLKNIKKYIYNGEVETASKELLKLKNIPTINKKVLDLSDKCLGMIKLREAYDSNNFISCYEILDMNNHLKSSELGVLLEKHFSKLIKKCEKFAMDGDIKSIKKSLSKLVAIESRKEKIGNLFRVSFLSKITSLIKNKALENAQSIIYTYIDTFGMDNDIYPLMKRFEALSSTKLAITQNQNPRLSRDYWITSKIIMD